MYSRLNNFCRVFELPDEYPAGSCFSGGHSVAFQMVDWFCPIPSEDLESNSTKPWRDYVPLLKKFLKGKNYIKPGKQYLLITDFGEVMLFTQNEKKKGRMKGGKDDKR